MISLFIEILLLIGLLFLSGFFSGSETALFSLSRIQIENLLKERSNQGKIVKDLLEKPRQLIVTLLIGNEFVNVAITSISAGLLIRLLGYHTTWLNIVIVLPILLLFGEITPKTIAIRHNESFAASVARPLSSFSRWITPLRWLIRTISDWVVNLFVKETDRRGSIITADVIKSIIEEGEKEGIIGSMEKEFVYKIFDFGDTKMDDVMTPRANLFFLPVSMPLKEMIREIKEQHISKVPVYRENRDQIVGILFATDLLGLSPDEINKSESTLKRILRKPYFVPVTKRADDLFRDFQKKKISIAVVLDEYGGVIGLVTMEDLLEVIFGKISDEYEKSDQVYEKIAENVYRIDSDMPLEDFSELFGETIVSDDVDTIGGFLFSLFGELPTPKATIVFHGMQFIVEKVESNRIKSIIVKKE